MTKADLDKERDRFIDYYSGETEYSDGIEDGWNLCYEYLLRLNLLSPAMEVHDV